MKTSESSCSSSALSFCCLRCSRSICTSEFRRVSAVSNSTFEWANTAYKKVKYAWKSALTEVLRVNLALGNKEMNDVLHCKPVHQWPGSISCWKCWSKLHHLEWQPNASVSLTTHLTFAALTFWFVTFLQYVFFTRFCQTLSNAWLVLEKTFRAIILKKFGGGAYGLWKPASS